MTWQCKKFNDLSTLELYKLMQLRSEVFVVEQNCVYLDADGKDEEAWHLFAQEEENIIACVRILAPGMSYKEPSIGRVCTHPKYRSKGLGKILMERSIDRTKELFPAQNIKIGAQVYLHNFYTELGFTKTSEMYLEDDIEHQEMLLRISN